MKILHIKIKRDVEVKEFQEIDKGIHETISMTGLLITDDTTEVKVLEADVVKTSTEFE